MCSSVCRHMITSAAMFVYFSLYRSLMKRRRDAADDVLVRWGWALGSIPTPLLFPSSHISVRNSPLPQPTSMIVLLRMSYRSIQRCARAVANLLKVGETCCDSSHCVEYSCTEA